MARKKPVVPDSLQRLEYEINGVPFSMQRVEGGSFMMGATWEQSDRDIYTNKPAHLVFLSPYYIATTEVTNALWRAVMPERETLNPRGYPTNPMSYVTWHDCQEFVRRLDSLTGMPFRLPTEAQWEYAARGGQQMKETRFAGSAIADSVGWTYPCAGNWTHPVARKQPNELGLYDMTGNVSEWCEDRYGPYQQYVQPDPCGSDTGTFRIARGGSYDDCVANSHLSVRRWFAPETSAGYIGFRLALTLPDDPTIQVVPEEPPLTRTLSVKGKRIRFIYVPSKTQNERAYYISDEINNSFWEKNRDRLWQEGACEATEAEVDTAIQRGLFITQQRKQKHWERDTHSIQQHRKMTKRASPWTDLLGIRVQETEDPVLKQYATEPPKKKTLRLVIHLH
ncbi:MAG: formylglycine-generating enzyme family protein [Paludibacteraceae bacterium]|nr:formylglycine-generating enzyme family protein [Paludibacteraceae bacterium]